MVKNVDNFDANLISEKKPIGYILKVDLEYEDELEKLYNDYPLAPEKLAIPMTCCQIIVKKFQTNIGQKWGM